MFDTVTRRASPTAASHAANTISITGIMLDKVNHVFRIIIVLRTNSDSIIPSRHNNDDIRWERYISNPSSATVNANRMFI